VGDGTAGKTSQSIRPSDGAHSFLLHIERRGRPCTYNHYFNSEVQKERQGRIQDIVNAASYTNSKGVTTFGNVVVDKANAQQIREDILDVPTGYYKVSRERFIDNICAQVIGHFPLEGDESPLKVFNTNLVLGLDDDQLELIAGEDSETKNKHSELDTEIKNLEAAMKILRC
jgi:hypothetical protein